MVLKCLNTVNWHLISMFHFSIIFIWKRKHFQLTKKAFHSFVFTWNFLNLINSLEKLKWYYYIFFFIRLLLAKSLCSFMLRSYKNCFDKNEKSFYYYVIYLYFSCSPIILQKTSIITFFIHVDLKAFMESACPALVAMCFINKTVATRRTLSLAAV